MATTYAGQTQLKNSYSESGTAGGGTLTAAESFGNPNAPVGQTLWTDGTGLSQAKTGFAANFTLNATSGQAYDMRGANGEVDLLNRLLSAFPILNIQEVYVELVPPLATNNNLQFGPQAQGSAAQLWFAAKTGTYWNAVQDKFLQSDALTGWPIAAGASVVYLYNPNAVAVSGFLRIRARQ